MFKGSSASILKALAINAALTGTYDYLNEKIWISFGDFGFNTYLATAWAAFWGSLVSIPFDNVKTRM